MQALIEDTARSYGLDPLLVEAVVQQESSCRPWAYNPEPAYRYLWDIRLNAPFRPLTPLEVASEIPPADFPSPPNVPRDAEWWGQQASWGLMQVMGAVAREYGFYGPFLTELCEPVLGLDYGCRHLAHYLRRYGGDSRMALAAYNGGPGAASTIPFSNAQYVEEVLARWEALKKDSRG